MELKDQSAFIRVSWIGIVVVICGLIVLWPIGRRCGIGLFDKPSLYEEQLKSEITTATLIKVTPVLFGDPEEYRGANSYEERDKEKVQEIIENIRIARFGYGGLCECVGNQCVEFYKGEELSAKLTFHHGKSFRWEKGQWKSDMELANESAEYIKEWMTQNGIKDFE